MFVNVIKTNWFQLFKLGKKQMNLTCIQSLEKHNYISEVSCNGCHCKQYENRKAMHFFHIFNFLWFR